ncbi:DNA recombination protein RmuC, partial [Arthrospira platensis SPKY1]|nr:DNA recombination protein RmuC [Arthrospira platensis SPKY1]
FEYAFSKRIVLVTPSTLLATLKTVASIWRLENQNRNALEIARLGSDLYHKLANFCEDMEEVGKRLDQAKIAHEKATSKLSTGRGNALRTIERMRDLGLSTKKEIPAHLLDSALAEGDEEKST